MLCSDEPEVRSVRDTDDEFREFVRARSSALLRTSYLLAGGDWALAEDLLQAALTKTYLAWGRIEDRNAIESYVRTTLATTATSWWRRRWHGERATAAPPERAGVDEASQFDERDALWRLVVQLPVRQRAVLVLRFYEDLSEAEIARTLGLSTGTVKSHTFRALATLRTELRMTGAS
ncbi:MAG: SigE family RNA polymerase sigma factor [Actinobacteria bacterium]|nr:SigE family RNA polymerase sigma factor [Actinomycetota bacterium]